MNPMNHKYAMNGNNAINFDAIENNADRRTRGTTLVPTMGSY